MTENTTASRCQLRQALRSDIPGMHRVRRAVRENPLTSDVIREEHYIPAIESSGRGWVVEEAGEVRAFAVGNSQTGNIWALFVDPAHEGRGFGRQLQAVMVDWLFSEGLERLNLGTAPGTRAEAFYRATGWTYLGIDAHGEASFEMRR
ncbi:GNAT family N-acetyltransferase [Paucibacter sp. DJ2R-2]|uniref:GNAT family N-acetyltransferase n=1 Tax=Paucibacter sp. DJ2R-2 TaxID=2893558 RepID=UPI0021E3A69C|nr:GNAT family N-acetyltransferase [Paucibacter sp. DJ2R-2]MCV2419186.1 GNAT family N-acetyltransferase [Paucibacter sp. DJ4R-1]MCV2437859.1 GNAT family N-acetyltransferase [Paucibacter sp. DJ2R-2]